MKRSNYLGPHKQLGLHLVCQMIDQAFGGYGTVLVGSAIERADYRDVDLRTIISDEDYVRLFGDIEAAHHNPLYRLICAAVSRWASAHTELPVDWQIQSMTVANRDHDGPRQSMGASPWPCCVYYKEAMEDR